MTRINTWNQSPHPPLWPQLQIANLPCKPFFRTPNPQRIRKSKNHRKAKCTLLPTSTLPVRSPVESREGQ